MSSFANLDNDDYVAKLLAEDARKSSVQYASTGTYALTPKRSANAAPKPNTRFLKTLVREADNHNAALKKKEELEARIRLREMREDKDPHMAERHRHRHHHRHRERSSEVNRRTSDDDEGERRVRSTRHEKVRSYRSRSPERHRGEQEPSRRRARRKHDDDFSGEDERHRKRSHHHRSSRKVVSRSRSGSSEHLNQDQGQPGRDTAVRPRHERLDIEEKTHVPRKAQPRPRKRSGSSSSSASSDPLSSLIGPHPPSATTTKRGRGFSRGLRTSTIDAHFSSSYDPSLDIATEENSDPEEGQRGGDDWDNALEALRDRRTWRAKQADRMREAGFGEDEIKRWEAGPARSRWGDGDGDSDPHQVKWRKPGEGREWDAGKIQDEGVGVGVGVETLDDVSTDEYQQQRGAPSGISVQRGSGFQARTKAKAIEKAWRGPENGLLKQFRSALG